MAHRAGLALADDWSDTATFKFPPIDKLDVTVYNGDALVQYETPAGAYEPADGVKISRGNFRSIPGLSAVYPPGPIGVRFRRASAGVGATVDFEAYALA